MRQLAQTRELTPGREGQGAVGVEVHLLQCNALSCRSIAARMNLQAFIIFYLVLIFYFVGILIACNALSSAH